MIQILETATVNNITLTVGDSWSIAENININLKELFNIDGQVYMAYTVDGHEFNVHGIDRETREEKYVIVKNRAIEIAEHFILQNIHLFS